MLKLLFIFLIFFYHANANDKSELIIHDIPKPVVLNEIYDNKDKTIIPFTKGKKFTIINFWATWCAPCIKEIPDLLKIQNTQKKKFDVIFVSVGLNPAKDVKKFVKKNKFKNMKIFYDKNLKFSKGLGVKTIPTTIVLDKKGMEIIKASGYIDWNSKEKKLLLKNL